MSDPVERVEKRRLGDGSEMPADQITRFRDDKRGTIKDRGAAASQRTQALWWVSRRSTRA